MRHMNTNKQLFCRRCSSLSAHRSSRHATLYGKGGTNGLFEVKLRKPPGAVLISIKQSAFLPIATLNHSNTDMGRDNWDSPTDFQLGTGLAQCPNLRQTAPPSRIFSSTIH